MFSFKRVSRESQANVVVVVSAIGWKGDRQKEKTLTGFYLACEDAVHEIRNCGGIFENIVDELFVEFRVTRPSSESWSVSEAWSRSAKRAGRVAR